MQNEHERARAQFAYEHEHRVRILKSPAGTKRRKAISHAYEGLREGIALGKFVNLEREPERKAKQKFRLLKRLLRKTDIAAEFGPGDYALAGMVAPRVRSLALIDVVDGLNINLPKNCRVYAGNGIGIPRHVKSVDVAWSSHVVEHIHPQDVQKHFASVRNALTPGGRYLVFTQNRFTGPHDISRRFSSAAKGLHLKEYTVTEIRREFLRAGFRSVRSYAGGRGLYVRVPVCVPLALELALSALPFSVARMVASLLSFRALLGIILVGEK